MNRSKTYMKVRLISASVAFIGGSMAMVYCNVETNGSKTKPISKEEVSKEQVAPYMSFFFNNPDFQAHGFDFPVGLPDAVGYYNAQKFGENNHLGDDWNGTGGGNSDLGDPVYAVGNGYVNKVYDAGPGWGNIVRIIHQTSDSTFVESLYAHLDSMTVKEGVGISKGEQLGTIGNANGAYWAHLHLEIRSDINKPLGGGYSSNTEGYLDPTNFIDNNRKIMWKKSR